MSALWRRSGKAIAPLLIGLLITMPVLADRGGRGGGGGGGGGGNQSSRSFSGGGGGSSFSSRSSGGGGGSSSMRSFSDGGSRSMRSFSSGDGGSSNSFRSFSGGDSSGSSRASFRSFSGNDGGSSSKSFRSFSGGDSGSSLRSLNSGNSGSTSRSFSEGARIRSDFRPSVRSLDNGGSSSGSSSMRSFSGSGTSVRSLNSGTTSDGGSRVFSDSSRGNSSNVSRTFSQSNGNNGVSQSGFQGRDGRSHVDQAQLQTFLNKQSGGQNLQSNSAKSDGRTTIYGQQFGSNNATNGQAGRSYEARRASGDEVRNFLNMQNKTGSKGNENGAVANGERSVLKENGQNFTRNHGNGNSETANSNASVGDRVSKDGKQFKVGDSANNPLNNDRSKSREWTTSRIGERGDQLNKHLNLDKSKGPDLGDGHKFGADKGIVRDGGDREFRGNDRARGEFKNWSKIWDGKKGEGHDHRDWSGKWRDGDRFDIAHDIRRDWRDRHDHDKFPFRGGWWGHDYHRGWGIWNDYCVRWNRPWFWWSWTSAPVLYDWCGFGWSTPYYWDYGPGEYIYCNDGVVYVNGVWYQPAPVFYQQTVQMVEAAPVLAQEAAAQVEWLPLGVFAATPDGLKEPSVMVQLAVTKDGIIGGTAFDQKAGKSYNIHGTVDKNTQRAVWSYLDDKNNRIVMETSVNNLTQNESTGLVHYGPNDMRVVEFVRLQEPDAKPADQPGQLPVPPQGK